MSRNRWIFYLHSYFSLLKSIFYKNKSFLIGTPVHGNLGDQAIAVAELYLLKKCSSKMIIEIPACLFWGKKKNLTCLICYLIIKKVNILFLHGGGNLGTLYPREEAIRSYIIKTYRDNKIIIMPQSIYFDNNKLGTITQNKLSAIYNTHPNLFLFCRDKNSYSLAKRIFPNVNCILSPDIVTSLYGNYSVNKYQRRGVLFLLRKDKEKVLPDSKIKFIESQLTSLKIPYDIADTIIPGEVLPRERERDVEKLLKIISRYKLVITDRFHGVIFSFLTNTPVITFKSFDTKISSGINWFDDIDWICYVSENMKDLDIQNLIRKYIFKRQIHTKNYTYKEKIINILKKIINA